MATLEALGEFERRGERVDLRFERTYTRSLETVWAALTDPVRLQDWMGAAYVEPHVGGRYELMLDGPNPMIGRIVVWEPPQTLAFTWSNTHAPASTARYELSRIGEATRLIFTHEGVPYLHSALMLPGWHMFFEQLAALLDAGGVRQSNHLWRELQSIYLTRYKFQDVKLDP